MLQIKSEGKSMGQIIEKYIGRTGKKLFFLFCWVFTLIVIAAFADMVAGTFNGFSAEGAKLAPNASAASISILYVFVAMAFGLLLRKVNLEGWAKGCTWNCLNRCNACSGYQIPCICN